MWTIISTRRPDGEFIAGWARHEGKPLKGPCVGCAGVGEWHRTMVNQKPDSGRMNRRKHPPASDLEPSLKKAKRSETNSSVK